MKIFRRFLGRHIVERDTGDGRSRFVARGVRGEAILPQRRGNLKLIGERRSRAEQD